MKFNCENCGWSKVVGSPIFCEYSEKRTFRENCCEAWKPKNNPVTNADRIRQMADEELAQWLAGYVLNITDGRQLNDATAAWLDWLKQEVESDG